MAAEDVRLIPLQESMLPQLMEWRNKLRHNFREYRLLNMENQKQWFASLTNDRNTVMFGIEDPKGIQPLVGVCGWTYIDWLNRRGELSIYIGAGEGQGYGLAAMKLLHQVAFWELGFQKTELECYAFNTRGLDFYRKFGYSPAGIWRGRHFYRGAFWDSHLMDMTRAEFEVRYGRPARDSPGPDGGVT